MKTILLKISFIFLFLSLMGAGCEKDDELLWEISPDSKTTVIQKEVDGVEFKFCLLNEKGEPATAFKEGENFSFSLSLKNNKSEPLPFYNYEYYQSSDFCEVRTESKSYGQPFIFKAYSGTLELRWLLPSNNDANNYNFIVPWQDFRKEWQLYWGIFDGAQRGLLSKGKYYTQFKHKFIFKAPNNDKPVLETDLITFKITFEIK
jgi:hypothetical protein